MMLLDGLTLMVAGCFVAALAGALLIATWVQSRASALLWWGSGHLANAASAAALATGMVTANPPLVAVSSVGLTASMMLYYGGVRAFFGRHPSPWIVAGIFGIWLGASAATIGDGARPSSATAFLAIAVILTLACAELWRTRDERLAARWGLIFVFAIHATFMAVGAIGIGLTGMEIAPAPSVLSWFGLVSFERLVFLVGSALFMIVMTRERQEMASMFAARVDSLTGIANRGAFLSRADRILRRSRQEEAPVSVIVFDLDHFKAINDTYGHAAGDRVLRAFADAASEIMRPSDVLGRIGGEEFAAILPGAGSEAAYVIADRVRHAFEVSPQVVQGSPVHATVSGGVALAEPGVTLEELMDTADRALYRAKALGRNRVERAAEAPRQPAAASNVIRVA